MPVSRLGAIILIALFSIPVTATYANPCVQTVSKTVDAPVQTQPGLAYLGARFGRVVPPVAAQLPSQIGRGIGIVVVDVTVNGPAFSAGLRRYDVISAVNGVPVIDPRQLGAMLIRSKPGETLNFTLARRGEIMNLPVILGSKPQPRAPHVADSSEQITYKSFTGSGKKAPAEAKIHFDAVAVETNDGEHFRAKLQFLDGNEKRNYKFEGTREEIAKEITGNQDIPEAEKTKLMKALGSS